jgi:hypothetical protein
VALRLNRWRAVPPFEFSECRALAIVSKCTAASVLG